MLLKVILFVTALLTALITGFFYAYSCSVNAGLGRLNDTEYLRAMQSINQVVLNPVFFASFLGTLVLLPVSTWLWFSVEGASTGFYLLLAASVIYLIFVFGVTGMGNVPLNEALDKFDLSTASRQEIGEQRTAFEIPWNRYHAIRTWTTVVSLVLLLGAIIRDLKL